MNTLELAKKYEEQIVALRREMHRQPEPAWQEVKTSAIVRRELDKLGIPYRNCGRDIGVLAEIRGGKPGKTVALRADMDALKVTEITGVEFASEKEGYMHACGHDGHVSMLLGAAMVLNELKDELAGTVRLLFQPAEEICGGAKAMIEEGALEGVDACFGIHLMAGVPHGVAMIGDGPVMSASDRFRVEVTGYGGHASQPHTTVDASLVTAAIVTALQSIVSRETDPLEVGVVSIGRMESGTLFNAIPATGVLEGSVRAYREDIRQNIEDAIKRIAESTAAAYRAKAEHSCVQLCKATVNAPETSALMHESAAAVLGAENVQPTGRIMVSEDFSEYGMVVPSTFAIFGIEDESCGAIYPNHNGRFCFNEEILPKGAALYAQTAFDFLRK